MWFNPNKTAHGNDFNYLQGAPEKKLRNKGGKSNRSKKLSFINLIFFEGNYKLNIKRLLAFFVGNNRLNIKTLYLTLGEANIPVTKKRNTG